MPKARIVIADSKIFIQTGQNIEVPSSIAVGTPDELEIETLRHYIVAYEECFKLSAKLRIEDFIKLEPANTRPYHNLYVGI